ncbi:MBL fold metallo-hydrolase [Sulfoacidibacillus thermotolerans]|uniref:Metallo-beta-lactamase domain-containing protein n=1 Tax=Sulfoacidibacillus thermotolerans TaxID=1765684 RepID=A0A2U3DB77_SULT2|nr:MBL fold metallo-hydrolase [Sulfoacidibacillus thermotolerans]PWI58530.1 hypothetical protein BM613_03165 [Sulfoacidibacillus thermotolerans]
MRIWRFTLNPLGTNTYVVSDDEGAGLIIDPSSPDMTSVLELIEQEKLQIQQIVNTHCHFDHVLGNEELRVKLGVPLRIHERELPLLENAPKQALDWLDIVVTTEQPDGFFVDGEELLIGKLRFTVLETPGHSPGGVCFYHATENVLFSGDTLFAGTVGRTDLPGADGSQLLVSLKTKLWPLPDQTKVYPGHEEDTTIGEERSLNPYFHFA